MHLLLAEERNVVVINLGLEADDITDLFPHGNQIFLVLLALLLVSLFWSNFSDGLLLPVSHLLRYVKHVLLLHVNINAVQVSLDLLAEAAEVWEYGEDGLVQNLI